MDVFQTTITAAELLYEFINSYAEYSHDAKSLAHRFDWDIRVLRSASTYFEQKTASNIGRLSTADKELLQASVAYFGELMAHISRKRNKIQAKGWLGTQWNRALWIHYKKELKDLEAELFEWTSRFDLRLVAVPPELGAVIQLDDPEANSAPRLAMKRRIKRYLAQPDSEKAKISEELYIPDPGNAVKFTSSIASQRMTATYNSKTSIVEYKPYAPSLLSDQEKLKETTDTVKELAGALSVVDPTLTALLPCSGYFHSADPNNPRFALIYSPPYDIAQSNPPTLKDLLNAKDRKGNRRTAAHPLDQRLNLARRLASAVYFYHSVGWVHKTIRSDNILMLEPTREDPLSLFPYTLGSSYLVNFASARADSGNTDLSLEERENEWFLNVYRHPARQGANISARFTMAHDAYSLGVVLLEIGTWRPLERSETEIKGKTPEEVRKVLLGLVDGTAIQMGSKYKELVKWCLELEDSNLGMSIYAEQVLERLESLVM
ncbi:MAG: hypothetical protein GOMPHAMPRED_004425 [Gomphillus americanus]|uniref:Protein kinase domain-containing protein n=1 Tax=Gomphillus americanus TaxID=1940652 RepID=A0A8H3FMV7_9LECA|nr:MAG: hypothetical protein GOMPHAMPRED_004425 [Gomphillus americanus]